MGLRDLIDDAVHNAKLYRSGRANKDEVRVTTVGWRPDPINEEDGCEKDQDAPSGNPNGEYYKVVRRKGTRE